MARKATKDDNETELKLVERKQKAAAKVKQADSQVTKSERHGFRILLIWLAVIAAVAGIAYVSHLETPPDTEAAQRTSSQLIADFQAGECASVFSKTTDSFRTRSTEENWNQQCGVASDVLQGEPELLPDDGTNTDSDELTFRYRIQGTDDQAYIVSTVMLHKADNIWQLDGLSSQVESTESEQPAE